MRGKTGSSPLYSHFCVLTTLCFCHFAESFVFCLAFLDQQRERRLFKTGSKIYRLGSCQSVPSSGAFTHPVNVQRSSLTTPERFHPPRWNCPTDTRTSHPPAPGNVERCRFTKAPVFARCLLMFCWPKQVTWPSPAHLKGIEDRRRGPGGHVLWKQEHLRGSQEKP